MGWPLLALHLCLQALQHLDSTNPFVLSLLLRALAEADAHVPALLAAAEPVLVEGVLGGHFTHKVRSLELAGCAGGSESAGNSQQ